jgi:hypothetical protein
MVLGMYFFGHCRCPEKFRNLIVPFLPGFSGKGNVALTRLTLSCKSFLQILLCIGHKLLLLKQK